jgi:phage shock protein A
MAYLKRWTSGLVSRVDSIAVKIENQEALVDSAVVDMSGRVARARVQLSRVKRDGEALRRRSDDLQREAVVWRDRARTEPDQGRALECLRRSKKAATRREEILERRSAHDHSEQRLRRDVDIIERKLDALREQRNTMRTRQTRAEALAELRTYDDNYTGDLDQVLERWDARIIEAEVLAGCADDDLDDFAERFEKEAERADLLAELDALRKEQT